AGGDREGVEIVRQAGARRRERRRRAGPDALDGYGRIGGGLARGAAAASAAGEDCGGQDEECCEEEQGTAVWRSAHAGRFSLQGDLIFTNSSTRMARAGHRVTRSITNRPSSSAW